MTEEGKNFELRLPELIGNRYRPGELLGSGAAGLVFAVEQQLLGDETIARALKVLHPRDIGWNSDKLEVYNRTFKQEIRVLASVTHRNIVKIIDAGSTPVTFVDPDTGSETKADRLFIVMELVAPPKGQTSALTLAECVDWLKKRSERLRLGRGALREAVLNLLLQVVDGLEYLHTKQIEHFDIKPANILCALQADGSLEAKLGDLGVAKRIPDEGGEGQTTIHGTRAFAPRFGWSYLNVSKPVDYSTLLRWRQRWDLFCLGLTIADFLSSKRASEEYTDRVNVLLGAIDPFQMKVFSSDELDLLKLIVRRLVPSDTEAEFAEEGDVYRSVTEVKEDLYKLHPSYLQPLRIPDFAIGGMRKSINLASGRLPLSERESGLIGHPLFRRLSGYAQLNFVHQSFPDARHSRFTHCLQVLRMAKKYVQGLLRDPYFRFIMHPHDYSLLIACALLHDIGHYPLAHAIEDLRLSGLAVPGQPSLVKRMLEWRVEEGGSLSATLKSSVWGVNPDAVNRVVGDSIPETCAEWLLRSILDGPIDVDKIAYLLHDSWATGVAYGSGVDVDALVGSLFVVPERIFGDNSCQIGIAPSGISAVTSVIGSRCRMFERVYWNHTNRSVMTMVKHVMKALLGTGLEFDTYLKDTLFFTDIEALRYLSKKYNELDLGQGDNPLRGLFDGRRELYKRLFEPSGSQEDQEIHKYLLKLSPEDEEIVRTELVGITSSHGVAVNPINGVLLDIPRTEPERDVRSVWVRFEDGRYKELSDLSDVVAAYQETFKSFVKVPRAYVSEGVRLSISETAWPDVKKEVRKHLRRRALKETRR